MSEKSALKLIPGKDALLEHENKPYQAKEYVEYQGYIYKAKVDTSLTFVPSEWSLVGDLRDVRVPNIESRNALTGSTPTTGTTGINIPILDNTNVLVLDASDDPNVGQNVFARYNYNKTTGEFLLLQVSTGSTGSNVSDYSELTNKPEIISGITATAGAGLSGGGTFSGGVPPTRATFSFAHADTSSQANLTPTGRTYIQQLKFDGFGHVTGATSAAWTHPDTSSQSSVNGTGFTYIQNVQLDGDGHVTALSTSTWAHPDTSSQGDVNNTGTTVIQSIQLDGSGHIIGIDSTTISSSGGGGGVAFSINGNSGGVRSMPDNGVLMVSGNSNISTITSSVGVNRVVKINFTPAGSNGQVQINNSGALGAGAGLTFLSNILTTPSFKISTTPTSGNTTQILTRNSSNGNLEYVGIRAFAALPLNAIQYRTNTGFGGNTNYLFDPSKFAVTLGTRTGTTGTYSFTVGTNNSSSLTGSMALGSGNASSAAGTLTVGTDNKASGVNSIAAGSSSYATNSQTFAFGIAVSATSTNSFAQGSETASSGFASLATGYRTKALNTGSYSGGFGGSSGRHILSSGQGSFNHSTNDLSQTVGHGALASQSAILGGSNNNINSTNTGAAIIGGNAIKLTGSTYSYHTAVSSLAIFTTPSVATSNDVLLAWNSTSKKVTRYIPNNSAYIAYVSETGSDSSGAVNEINRPFASGTAALAAIKTYAGKTNPATIYFLPGSYTIAASQPMTFDNYSNISIYLENATIIGTAPSSTEAIRTTTSATGATNIQIDGSGTLKKALYIGYSGTTGNINVSNYINNSVIDCGALNINTNTATVSNALTGRNIVFNCNRMYDDGSAGNGLGIGTKGLIVINIDSADFQLTRSSRTFSVHLSNHNSTLIFNAKNIYAKSLNSYGLFDLEYNSTFTGGTFKFNVDNCVVAAAMPNIRCNMHTSKIYIKGRWENKWSQSVLQHDYLNLISQPMTFYIEGGTSFITQGSSSITRLYNPFGASRTIGIYGTAVTNKAFGSGVPAASIGTLIVDANVE